MTAFLLVGSRRPGGPERSPALAARDAAALTTWHQGLRCWGLVRSIGVPDQDASTGETLLCLIVQVSGAEAAERLATRWEQLGGYRVTVLALHDATGRRRAI
jgi:hypothetical protein